MKSTTKRFIGALIALLFFVGAFIVFFDLVQPTYGDVMTLKGKLAAEQALLVNQSSTIAQINKVMGAYASQTDSQAAVSAALPVGANLSGAVAQLYGAAQANSIAIQNVSVSITVPQTAGAKSGNTALTSGSGVSLRPTGTVAFAVTASGNYENFMNFLSAIEGNLRIFDLRQLSIQPASGKPGQDFFNYVITLNTYYQLP